MTCGECISHRTLRTPRPRTIATCSLISILFSATQAIADGPLGKQVWHLRMQWPRRNSASLWQPQPLRGYDLPSMSAGKVKASSW